MKRVVAFSAILLLGSLVALAEPSSSTASPRFSNPILGDVVQMSKAGLSDATIVAFLRARRARLGSDVGAEDLISLQKAGVSEKVVSYIAGVARIEDVPDRREPPVAYDSWRDRDNRSSSVQPVQPEDPSYGEDEAYSDGDAYPGVYDGDPYWYGYPYWYAYSPYYFYGGGPFFRGRGFIGHGGGRFSGHGGGHPSGGHGGHSSSGGHSSGGHSGGSGGHGHH